MAALLAASASMATLSAQTDVTAQYLTNPDFEGTYEEQTRPKNDRAIYKPEGWTVSLDPLNENDLSILKTSDLASSSFGGFTVNDETTRGAQTYWFRYRWGSNQTLKLSQSIENLPAGVYRLTADVLNYSTNYNYTVMIYAGLNAQSRANVSTSKGDNWNTLSCDFYVENDGNVEIGFSATNPAAAERIFAVDNFKLYKLDAETPSPEFPVSMNGYIVNPCFDSNTNGWTYTTGAVNHGLASNKGGAITGNFYENWNPGAYSGTIEQTINNLPLGVYTIRLAAFRNGGTGNVCAFANNDQAPVTTTDGEWYEVTTKVTDGSLTFGVKSIDGGCNWMGVDNASLMYQGVDLDMLKEALASALKTAKEFDQTLLNTYAKTKLDAAISVAESVKEEEKPLKTATQNLVDCIAFAKNIAAVYPSVIQFVDDCKSIKDNSIASDKTAFESAINDALAAIETAESVDDILAVKNTLEAARQVYVLAAEPNEGYSFDLTFMIKNAGFESGTKTNNGGAVNLPVDWNVNYKLSGWLDGSINTAAPSEGSKLYNCWAGNVTSIDLYQDVASLPAGKYRLAADMRAEKTEFITDQGVYATAGGETVKSGTIQTVANPWNSVEGWNNLSVEFMLMQEGMTTRVGASSTGSGEGSAGWFQVDNFTLQYLRALTPEEKAQGYINALNATIAQAEAINTTTNVGEGAFQYSAASVEALQAAIATAKAVSTTDIETLVAADEALKAAMEAYQLNAPAEGEVFNVIIRTNDGYKFKDIPVAFREDGKAGMFFEPTYVGKPHMAQYVTFTKVEGADNYVLSTIFADGVERFMATGITSGEGNSTAQIRLTADKDKALVTKVIATETEGIYRLLNTEANAYIGCQDGDDKAQGGMYTNSGSHVDLALVAVEKPEVTLNVTEAGFATLVLPFKAEIPEGIKVYTTEVAEAATANGNRVLTLTEATEIAANTAYIVEGAAGTYTFTGVGAAYSDTYTTGLLTGTFVSMTAAADTYVLQVNNGITGFYHVAEGAEPTVAANRAYLTAPAGEAEVTAFVFGDIQTGIQGVEAAADTMVDVYTIDGVRVREGVKAAEALKGLAKGIYVVNGAKKAVK